MNALFRVDASLEMGTGHVMRCLTLAETLRQNGVEVEFISREHQGNEIKKIEDSGFKVYKLEHRKIKSDDKSKLQHSHWLGVTQIQDAFDCIDLIKGKFFDWLIVDHYALDEEWQNNLRTFYGKLLIIDDLSDRKHNCDVLLDQTYNKSKSSYKKLVPPRCKLLIGSKYALLRSEFTELRSKSLRSRIKPKLKNLLINMGGIDKSNHTSSVLTHLSESELSSGLNISVVMGSNSPFLDEVKSLADKLPMNIQILENVKKMAELMASSDIAIGASGTTTWERCCMGLPTIQIVTASNQKPLADNLAKKNIIKLVRNVEEINGTLENFNKWMKASSDLASQVCDGIGSIRTFNNLCDHEVSLEHYEDIKMCNYINLNKDDLALALRMRNHESIRYWMHNKNIISDEEHENFIYKLESSTTERYFLIKFKKAVLGSISFTKIKPNVSIDFGIYTNPFSDQTGSGRLLEEVASTYAFEQLKVKEINLQVYEDNKRAIDFYFKSGFKTQEIKEFEGKNIVNMIKRAN